MRLCKLVELAVIAVPIPIWQDFWIRRHILKCPECRAKLADREEAGSCFVRPEEIGEIKNFWPGVRSGLQSSDGWRPGPMAAFIRGRLRAAGAVVLAAVFVLTAVGLLRRLPESSGVEDAGFRLHDIRIDDRPAQAYLFQPKNTKIVIVWAEKAQNGG